MVLRKTNLQNANRLCGGYIKHAMCESFFATLKCELRDRKSIPTVADARRAIFCFIKGFYNTRRLHSAYKAPANLERFNHAA